jgi:hypothetical protein
LFEIPNGIFNTGQLPQVGLCASGLMDTHFLLHARLPVQAQGDDGQNNHQKEQADQDEAFLVIAADFDIFIIYSGHR